MENEVEELIKSFSLIPHPEGGYYRETYRARANVRTTAGEFDGSRSASTAIYYLLPAGAHSAFHRIKSDEVWHFYQGGPLKIIEIAPTSGALKETTLGNDSKKGEVFQYVVPAGHWFGAVPMENTLYSFVGCTVAPGFDFQDFELANPATFLTTFPAAKHFLALIP